MNKEINKSDEGRRWLNELRLAKKEDEKWVKRGKKIVRRYRDERAGWSDTAKRYNILWSNIQTIFPAIYGKTPRAQVERRFKDQDPVGRCASVIMERALQYEIDHYGTFDSANKSVLLDRLLSGRGTAWVRFEVDETESIEGQAQPYGKTCEDYVYWEDFRCSPARNWEEVTWVARRVYMTREDGIERFGEDFKEVPLTHEPIGLDEMKSQGASQSELDSLKKAQVWEIWDKPSKAVYWVAEGASRVLDVKPDPYKLDGFWPCPRPLYATQTTDTLQPVPDFSQYQDQAEELDKLTHRIHLLVEAVKVVGVYDASQQGVQRMLSEGVNNTLIPVDTWAAFSEKGGLKGVVDFLPLDMVLVALTECYKAREQVKQVIYEITGLSDIVRGASIASETATAQQIKSQYASLRIKRLQYDVAMFASELLRIKAQLMADLYPPEQLIEQSGIMGTQDAQYVEQAIQLMKMEPVRNFRIEVAADSLVEIDEATEKQSRMEFLQATGAFMQQALPVIQQAPDITPLVAEMLLFGVRAFKGGRPMEAAFDDAMAKLTAPKPPPPPQPDPEQVKMQATMQVEQGRMQLEQAKLQSSIELEQFKAQQAQQLEVMRQQAETERAQMKAQIEAETKLQIAAMQKEGAMEVERQRQRPAIESEVIATSEGLRDNIVGQVHEIVSQFSEAINDALENSKNEIISIANAPKRIIRGPNGKALGVESNGEIRTIIRGADGRAEGI